MDAARVVPLVVRAGELSLHHTLGAEPRTRSQHRSRHQLHPHCVRHVGQRRWCKATTVTSNELRPRADFDAEAHAAHAEARAMPRGVGPCTRAGPPRWRQTRAERQEHEGERSWSLAQTTLCTVRPRSPRCFRQFRVVDSTPQPRDWISTAALRPTRPRSGRRPPRCLGRGRALGCMERFRSSGVLMVAETRDFIWKRNRGDPTSVHLLAADLMEGAAGE